MSGVSRNTSSSPFLSTKKSGAGELRNTTTSPVKNVRTSDDASIFPRNR